VIVAAFVTKRLFDYSRSSGKRVKTAQRSVFLQKARTIGRQSAFSARRIMPGHPRHHAIATISTTIPAARSGDSGADKG
jgi:hypothetical protein